MNPRTRVLLGMILKCGTAIEILVKPEIVHDLTCLDRDPPSLSLGTANDLADLISPAPASPNANLLSFSFSLCPPFHCFRALEEPTPQSIQTIFDASSRIQKKHGPIRRFRVSIEPGLDTTAHVPDTRGVLV